MSAADHQPAPVITVTRGRPTPAELAAAIAVLLAVRAARGVAVPPPPARPSRWTERSRVVRVPPQPGPGAWRSSALPR
ncbi:MAG TPA: acyl-CoA carboxylase epsilon subunit [Trebonia sp.]